MVLGGDLELREQKAPCCISRFSPMAQAGTPLCPTWRWCPACVSSQVPCSCRASQATPNPRLGERSAVALLSPGPSRAWVGILSSPHQQLPGSQVFQCTGGQSEESFPVFDTSETQRPSLPCFWGSGHAGAVERKSELTCVRCIKMP